MKQKIISNAELKLLLGITGTAQDALVELWNRKATELLSDFLGVQFLVSHSVINEHVKQVRGDWLLLKEFPVDTSSITIKDMDQDEITGYTFGQYSQDSRKVNVLDSSGDPSILGYEELLASYTAGYTVKETIQVLDYASLVGKTITAFVNGVETEYEFVASGPTGNQIVADTDNNTTASNIATALIGTASTDTVTLPLGTFVELGTATTFMLTITSATIPEALKTCVAFLSAAGLAEKQKAKGISSYTIGGKSVNFVSRKDADFVRETVEKFAGHYRKFEIHA